MQFDLNRTCAKTLCEDRDNTDVLPLGSRSINDRTLQPYSLLKCVLGSFLWLLSFEPAKESDSGRRAETRRGLAAARESMTSAPSDRQKRPARASPKQRWMNSALSHTRSQARAASRSSCRAQRRKDGWKPRFPTCLLLALQSAFNGSSRARFFCRAFTLACSRGSSGESTGR